MKKLNWKKKKYDDLTIWVAEVKTVGWEFTIEKTPDGYYESFVYYGCGEDVPLLNRFAAKNLKEAQDICNNWLESTILGLNKWI